eukprot:6206592-Pleurochrysis_carterae.AAC.2
MHSLLALLLLGGSPRGPVGSWRRGAHALGHLVRVLARSDATRRLAHTLELHQKERNLRLWLAARLGKTLNPRARRGAASLEVLDQKHRIRLLFIQHHVDNLRRRWPADMEVERRETFIDGKGLKPDMHAVEKEA